MWEVLKILGAGLRLGRVGLRHWRWALDSGGVANMPVSCPVSDAVEVFRGVHDWPAVMSSDMNAIYHTKAKLSFNMT